MFDIQRTDKETEFTFSALEELKVSRDYKSAKQRKKNKQTKNKTLTNYLLNYTLKLSVFVLRQY